MLRLRFGPTMSLNLYRRHERRCAGGHLARSQNTKGIEKPSKGWVKCDCPIYVSGTLKDGFKRKNTGCSDWDRADTVAVIYQGAGSWSEPVAPVEPAEKVVKPEDGSITIEAATNAFILRCQTREIQ